MCYIYQNHLGMIQVLWSEEGEEGPRHLEESRGLHNHPGPQGHVSGPCSSPHTASCAALGETVRPTHRWAHQWWNKSWKYCFVTNINDQHLIWQSWYRTGHTVIGYSLLHSSLLLIHVWRSLLCSNLIVLSYNIIMNIFIVAIIIYSRSRVPVVAGSSPHFL